MNSLNRATAPVIVRAFVGSLCPWVSQSLNERFKFKNIRWASAIITSPYDGRIAAQRHHRLLLRLMVLHAI
jgi:hypothetical protein